MSRVLKQTESVCPACLARIPAAYVARDGGVWLDKTCPAHGPFAARIWDSEDGFESWLQDSPTQPPHHPARRVDKGCPYDCGLCDAHQQASCCVLLEVTARCNLQCPVCYAAAQTDAPAPDPSLATIEGWYDMLLEHGGPFNIQLSGGEPTLRDDLPAIIRAGRQRGFPFFQLNTNGLRLSEDPAYLRALVKAGLSTVFLQFDSLRGEPTTKLRGRDLVAAKQEAVRQCAAAGVGVVLVPTVKGDCNLEELGAIVDFAAANMPAVRGVHFQPVSFFGRYNDNTGRVTIPTLLKALETQTGGRVQAAHFAPGGAEHALCTFHADYAVDGQNWTPQKGAATACCTPTSDRARDAVALKWTVPASQPVQWQGSSRYDLSSLDDFLHKRKTHTLALSGMAFQDAWTLDLERLRRCHVHIVSQNGELIPFCACNLTSQEGQALHR